MRFNTCAMLNKLQSICWPDNTAFQVEDVEVVGFHAHSATAFQRLEGMITVAYRRHTPLEQDLLVGLLLAMHMANDIPEGARGSGLKWCPIRNEASYSACTVTRVSTRRTARGYCRQDIPLGNYDRKQRRWTLQRKHKEIDFLINLTKRGDDSSLDILDKLRSAPWRQRPPNLKLTREKNPNGTPSPREKNPNLLRPHFPLERVRITFLTGTPSLGTF